MSHKQQAAGNKIPDKLIHQHLLCLLIKIYHHITAEYDVELALELKLVHQIKLAKLYKLFQ